MKRQLFRIKNAKYPKIPKNINEIVDAMEDPMIRRNFGYTFNGDNEFYAGTVITAKYNFVVFVSQKATNIIEQFIPPSDRRYLFDGTFKVAPRHFYQLMVISVEFRDDVSWFLSSICLCTYFIDKIKNSNISDFSCFLHIDVPKVGRFLQRCIQIHRKIIRTETESHND